MKQLLLFISLCTIFKIASSDNLNQGPVPANQTHIDTHSERLDDMQKIFGVVPANHQYINISFYRRKNMQPSEKQSENPIINTK